MAATSASASSTVEVVRVIAERGGTAPEWEVASTTSAGEVPAALPALRAEHEITVLVVGSRRRTEVGKFLMGGTMQRILLDSPVPVLVVKTP